MWRSDEMYHIQAESLTKHALYKFLIGTVVPRPIALITTLSEEGITNIAPFSFFNIVSSQPPILSVAIQRHDDGTMKDTARHITSHKEAIVHVVTETNVHDANQTAAPLNINNSELDLTQFTTCHSSTSCIPALNESPVRFETRLNEHIEIKTEGHTVSDLMLLEIKHLYIDETLYDSEQGYVDVAKLQPVSRLAGDDYATLGNFFTIERPRFKRGEK